MAVPYFYTTAACHARQRLDEQQRAVVDRAVLGLSLVPTLGSYDCDSDTWWYAAADDVLVQYQVLSVPEPQVVIVHVGSGGSRERGNLRRLPVPVGVS